MDYEIREAKVQTGLRIPEKKYNELANLSEETGVSINTLVLTLTEIGLKVIRLGSEEVLRDLIHNQREIS